MNKTSEERFRGLHSYYDEKTDTHFIYIYDKKTHNLKASLKIIGNKIQVTSGEVLK